MNSYIVYSEEEYFQLNDDFSDKKVLYVWLIPGKQCQKCHRQECVGRMNVRKNTSHQYAMGVCRECFDKE